MGIQVALKHRTEYRYEKPIFLGPHIIQLRPTLHCRTPILSYSLDVAPAEHITNWQLDLHSNRLARILFPHKTNDLSIEVNLVADLSPINPFDFFLEPAVAEYPFTYPAALAKDLEPYLSTDAPGPLLQQFLGNFAGTKTGTVSFILDVNKRLRDDIDYVTRFEPGVQSCEETLAKRSGSCRDSAWLLVQSLRNLGIASRFVSGYLIQLADDSDAAEKTGDGPSTDSADLHAWAEAYLPGAGWIGMDPTSGLLAAEGHIPLVCTPTASQAAPIAGTAEPAGVELIYSMSIRRLNESRRSLTPFTEDAWLRLRDVAHRVDEDLKAHDARITMGGEPTYVSVDDPESPEWNIDAMGPKKRGVGLSLIQALRSRIAPGALLHYGQGKWYPGEPLPRWAMSCYWRADGIPVWEDVQLIARENQEYKFVAADALKFAQALARRLQASSENLLPAYNPDADQTEPAGYVLPLRRRQFAAQLLWSSQLWFDRPQHLVLSPGDSPIGYRIPTDAMPWVAPDEIEYEPSAAPFEQFAKLPARLVRRMELFEINPNSDPLPAVSRAPETAPELIRPSLCVQVREGRMHVFLPYAPKLPDYLDLVSAVEDTCRYLQTPAWIEGYPPTPDPRLRSFSVTPDPGVLEINLPPASDWDELERINTLLDEQARRNRLTALKFSYEGTQLATGGGSHIVVGGATLEDSPFLRRPDLLRSMVTFWQNHPSLSYLFSGMYVGPTSQYPRVDEARMDALYELEVAFAHLPVSDCPGWILDGLFRNILVDVTGNSHRAEFCIDKLHPPEGQGLRLGLLELRAFEMAPHVRMNLLQMMLVRALVSTFWKTPYKAELIRWGAALHDRFMLPIYIETDLSAVLSYLRQAGYNFEEQWFNAHFDFRFPRIGAVFAEGVELELRHALEPWNVLAEETTSGRTGRSVDSSLQRMQVKLSGAPVESQYVVTCNGRRVPLQRAAEPGAAVGAVRYRARRLSASLHPTVPIHAPLVFNLIDRFTGRSIAQCTYHVVPPNDLQYDGRPVNLAEAEQRRSQRFEVSSSSLPNPMSIIEEEPNPVFPMTLDLRLPPRDQSKKPEPPELVP